MNIVKEIEALEKKWRADADKNLVDAEDSHCFGDYRDEAACRAEAAVNHDHIQELAALRQRVEGLEGARYLCNGPEGTFQTDDHALAEQIIGNSFDRDEWTITDMSKPLPAPAVDGEWVMVPREPTPEMLWSAGTMNNYDIDAGGRSDDDHADWWRAMLAAAPAAPAAVTVDDLTRRIDVALNGDEAAIQASLGDIVGQCEAEVRKRGRAILAAPAALDVDELAQEIRRVDGNHKLGAGALAEALMPLLVSRAAPAALTCPECKSTGLLFSCVMCSAHNYPPEAAPAAGDAVAWWDGTRKDYRTAFSAFRTKTYTIPLYAAPAAVVDEARWQAFAATLSLNLEEPSSMAKSHGVTARYKYAHTDSLWNAWNAALSGKQGGGHD